MVLLREQEISQVKNMLRDPVQYFYMNIFDSGKKPNIRQNLTLNIIAEEIIYTH